MDRCSASLKAYAIEEYEEKTQLKKGIRKGIGIRRNTKIKIK